MSRRHKYKAQATEVDGIRFASKKEARRYSELRMPGSHGAWSVCMERPA